MPARWKAGHATCKCAARLCAIALQFWNAAPLANRPSVPAKPVAENRPRGLLLVEEYGALAVAIKSALPKFAAFHTVRVAPSFSRGLELANEIRPELFVLDLDPPPVGAIPFLIKLRADYPESRILVLAAGTSVTLCTARGKSAAIHFVEKPFDLTEFGAAVQDLIGPWNGGIPQCAWNRR